MDARTAVGDGGAVLVDANMVLRNHVVIGTGTGQGDTVGIVAGNDVVGYGGIVAVGYVYAGTGVAQIGGAAGVGPEDIAVNNRVVGPAGNLHPVPVVTGNQVTPQYHPVGA